MALTRSRDAARPAPSFAFAHPEVSNEEESFDLTDFEEELRRLSSANQELLEEINAHEHGEVVSLAEPAPLSGSEALALLRMENTELKAHIQELEAALQSRSGQSEDVWLDRQREYETLLEEKSEVIRHLHQKLQEAQDIGGPNEGAPASNGGGTGQAEEILRLKRELDEQRRQLHQDEEDMMAQLRQMELMMARERAEMARQRQEMNRLQADLTREIEMASRDPGLRERLQHLRRPDSGTKPVVAALPTPLPAANTDTPTSAPRNARPKTSGLFRRIFG